MSRSVQNNSACVKGATLLYTVHCYLCTYYAAEANKLVTRAEKSVYQIKMIIKVSHCSSGKIMVSGHSVGSTETQVEAGGSSGQAGTCSADTGDQGRNLNENLNSLITLVLSRAGRYGLKIKSLIFSHQTRFTILIFFFSLLKTELQITKKLLKALVLF